MQYKGHLIEGDFDYVLSQGEDVDILDVFANIINIKGDMVTVERFTNYGRHQLPTVVKPLDEFQREYDFITYKGDLREYTNKSDRQQDVER